MRAVVFSGTTEGRIFSRQLAQFGADVLVSVATPLGSEEQGSFAGITVHCGRLTPDEMAALVQEADLCVDATHPYAVDATRNIRTACRTAGVEYHRLLRAQSPLPTGSMVFQSAAHVADFLAQTQGNVLLATGAKELAQFAAIPPERLYEMYAMTECIGMTSIRGDEWLRHPGSVGKMHCGRVSIRDEDGHELPTGEIGEIFMSWGDNSPRVIYKNIPPLPTDSEGFRSVGDMGYVDAEGYLYFADRRSDMIVTGGENVFAAEVEMVLKKHPKVVDAVVIGLPDPDWGHRIHAIVETNGPVGNKDLIRFALNYLPPYKIPKSIELVDHIPVNENGKVVRSKLVEESLAKGY